MKRKEEEAQASETCLPRQRQWRLEAERERLGVRGVGVERRQQGVERREQWPAHAQPRDGTSVALTLRPRRALRRAAACTRGALSVLLLPGARSAISAPGFETGSGGGGECSGVDTCRPANSYGH